jgi:hypothetical protein
MTERHHLVALPCKDCGKPGRWHVWYKGCTSPQGGYFPPANIAYNTLCDEHAINDILRGRNGWQVEQVSLVADQFLPDDDRARDGYREELIESESS